MSDQTLSHWGWGFAARFPDAATRAAMSEALPLLVGFPGTPPDEPVPIDAVRLPEPRVESDLPFVTADRVARIRHTWGRSYPELLRGYRGDFGPAPDLVATPRDEAELEALLAWASAERIVVVPRGGGTSVCGGVTPEDHAPWVCLTLSAFDRVSDVDRQSLTARMQAGLAGPAIEAALAPHDLTLRHYPQSFEFSTLGGWIATRAGGHFATNYTHIDDLVASVRMVTPSGVWESRRLPGSGAGPSPDRLVLGSEGILGVITEATMRIRPRPTFKARASVTFDDYDAAVGAVRAIAQSRLYPSNCRLLDRREALLNRLPRIAEGLLLLAFESADHPVGSLLDRALTLATDHGGTCPDGPVVVDGGPPTSSTDAGASLEAGVLRRSVPAVRAHLDRGDRGHLRDRSALGSLRRSTPGRHRCGAGRDEGPVGSRLRQLSVHTRLPRWACSLLHLAHAGGARSRTRAMAGGQGGGIRGDPDAWRNDYPPSRGGAAASSLVCPAASCTVRRGPAGGQESRGSSRRSQSRGTHSIVKRP